MGVLANPAITTSCATPRAAGRGALHSTRGKSPPAVPSRRGLTLGAAEVEYAAPRDSCAHTRATG